MKRRKFLGWMGVSAIASSLPVAIAACTPREQQTMATKAIGTLAELDEQGFILVESETDPVLAIRNPENADEILAVNPTCTHRGCLVEWQSDETAFVCPCHDAKFTPDGAVVGGPAEAPLTTLAVTLDGDSIMVGG